MSGLNTAPGLPSKPAAAVGNCAVSFDGKLDQGELLDGTPTVAVAPTGPTISEVAVTVVGKVINNKMVPAGRAVTFSVSGGTNGTKYTFTVTCATNSIPAQTLVGYTQLKVENK